MEKRVRVFAALALAFGALRAEPSSSSTVREWLDEKGQVIKRVDPAGRMFLLTWDVVGNLVRMDGIAKRVDPATTEGAVPSGAAWVHIFLYEEGKLAAEFDCVGDQHNVRGRSIHPVHGTALVGHKHIQAAGEQP